MPNTTKQALEESLKHMLLKKPLDKITIRDITEDCGISRMAFYYHFKDIYDLVEWACIEDASKALQGKKTYETWQEGLLQIFEAVLENKPFILNAYRCISREQMERFLYQLTYGLIRGVVERLEKEGAGLNLTWEVRNGIERHTGGEDAATLEGQVVRLADKIAYINHDIEDALRGGVIYPIDIPLEVSQVLGFTHGERINALVVDAISASRGQDRICQSPQVGEAMAVLKEFMFANVYTNPIAKGEESKAQDMLKMLFGYYQKNPDELPADFQAIRLEEGVDRAVCDYIAGMTDPFAVSEYTRLFIPMGWGVK